MDTFYIFWVFSGVILGVIQVDSVTVTEATPTNCPLDYRRRVETCIMDAQVAPQAGGGLSLIINNNTIVDLCHRGLLRKTIDCLQEIRTRCAHNATTVHELDRLYSVSDWEQGAQLMCEDTEFFQANQECLDKCTTTVMTCVLLRTQIFRMSLGLTDPSDHAKRREVTCNFAESIVKCLRSPLSEHCPPQLVKQVAGGMFRFLPPFCHTDNYITVSQRPEELTTEEMKKEEKVTESTEEEHAEETGKEDAELMDKEVTVVEDKEEEVSP